MSSFFLSEAIKLKNIQIFLEKSVSSVYCLSKYDESDLGDYFHQKEKNRNAEVEHIFNELKTIWSLLQSKKTALKEDINALDLKSFKKDLLTIQEKIFDMKAKLHVNLQELKDQEKDANDAVEIFNHRLDEWEKPIKYFASINYKINSSTTSTQYNGTKEVKEFMDFINKSNGHENGWSNNDHQQFLKFRRKYKDMDNLAINLNKLLPDITVDNIKQHEIWYRRYLELKAKRDEAIKTWRFSKNENVHQITNENNKNKKPKDISTRRPSDKNLQEQIAVWKAEKEAKRQREYENEQIRIERMKQLQNEKRKLHDEVKQSVAKWKEAKLMKERNEKFETEVIEHQQRKIRAIEANKLIKEFQSQDDIFITRIRNKRLQEKNEIRRTKSSYISTRDPQRLLKPTKQWLLRTSKDNLIQKEGPPLISNIRTIPKL